MDQIAQLNVFVQIAERGSFTRAAEALGAPRSTLSNALAALEDRLGEKLFYRTTRVVRLTPQGERFLPVARDLLDATAHAYALFDDTPAGVSGRLRVNMTTLLATTLVLPKLSDFTGRHPLIELDLSTSDRLIDPVREGVDLVIRAAELEDSDLICRRIGSIPMATCASPAYLERFGAPRTPDDLTDHRIVGYGRYGEADTAMWEGMGPHGLVRVAMKSALTVDGTESYYAAGREGYGLVQIPACHLTREPVVQHLVAVLADWPPPPLPLSFLYARRKTVSPRLRVFMDWMTELLMAERFVRR